MKFRLLFLLALVLAATNGWASGQATITASVEALDFGEAEVGYTVTKSFMVTGHDLSDNISLMLTGHKTNFYQVTPATITPEQAAIGIVVSVQFIPYSTYVWPADLILSSTDAQDVIIPITATAFFPAESFVNKQTEEFTALVGQRVTHTGIIRFADAEVPTDPNQPVVRSYGNGMTAIDFDVNLLSPDYSIILEGNDAIHFTARIIKSSAISKVCTVAISYMPRTAGTHEATLKAYCSRAGVPWVTIPLHGETTGVLGDLDGDGMLDIHDLTDMIGMVLYHNNNNNSTRADFDQNGSTDIDDVTKFISFLLNAQ